MEEYVDVEFEGHMFKAISHYDAFLRGVYGDYMQFPPEEEQHSKHLIAYLNLDKRESYEDVIAKIKSQNI